MTITNEQAVHVRYYRIPAGGLGQVEESHPGATVLPAGAVEIDQAEYDAGIAAWQAEKDAYVNGLRQAEQQQAEADLQALLDLGLADATARRLVGVKLLAGGS